MASANKQMESGNPLDDVPGRFSAHIELSGDVAEAEHLARYAFASGFAQGRRVLDAGCGWAYGTAMLSAAGAKQAVGLDLAPTVVEVAQHELGDAVELHVGDVTAMPFEDDGFDLVVCFEVIEHIDARADAIAEMRRVLAPGGLLIISSPNIALSPPGNPYHVHEYEPEEFRQELEGMFSNVALVQQSDFLVSMVLDPQAAPASKLETIEVELHKGVATPAGREAFMVALASDAPLPPVERTVGVASSLVELARWVELYAKQDETLRAQHAFITDLDLDRFDEQAAELRKSAQIEAQLLARVSELELEAKHAEERADALRADILERDALLDRADRVRQDIFSSLSWRITKPLRRLRRG